MSASRNTRRSMSLRGTESQYTSSMMPSININSYQLCPVQVLDGKVRQCGLDLERSHRSVDLLRPDGEVEDARDTACRPPDF